MKTSSENTPSALVGLASRVIASSTVFEPSSETGSQPTIQLINLLAADVVSEHDPGDRDEHDRKRGEREQHPVGDPGRVLGEAVAEVAVDRGGHDAEEVPQDVERPARQPREPGRVRGNRRLVHPSEYAGLSGARRPPGDNQTPMADLAELLSTSLDDLMVEAHALRARGTGTRITYSPKVFVPLTTLCRDVCGYCTFARPPAAASEPSWREDEVLAIARAGAAAGCSEALFTLGDRPEARYRVAREELATLGCETTLEYLARCARLVLDETGLLPHLNPGVMSREELSALRPVAASMGLMLETSAHRWWPRAAPRTGRRPTRCRRAA